MRKNQNENETSKKSGHWTKEEHKKFLEGIVKYGKDWKKIVEVVGTRSGDQVRSHAQKYFINLEKKSALKSVKEKREAFCMAWQALGFSAYVRCLAEMQRVRPNFVPETMPVKVIIGEEEAIKLS